MKNFPAPEAVFFDWDGTLVDTLPWLLSAHNHVRAYLELPEWSSAEFREYVRYSSRELYGPLYGSRADEALGVLRDFTEKNHLSDLKTLPDAAELLEFLRAAKVPVGLVSNKRHEFLVREVAHLGWDDYFAAVVGAGVAARDKPAADPLILALSRCDLTPGPGIWYVGDSETDMLTARAAGCSAILVRHHHDNAHLAERFAPEAVFDDCRNLQNSLIFCRMGLKKKD